MAQTMQNCLDKINSSKNKMNWLTDLFDLTMQSSIRLLVSMIQLSTSKLPFSSHQLRLIYKYLTLTQSMNVSKG